MDKVRNSKFFLFKNDGGFVGERAKCHRVMPNGTTWGCGRKHMYFTYMCIDRPYRGLEDGLWAVYRACSDSAKRSSLLRTISHLPDLSESHPQTARILEPDEDGEIWYSTLLSLPEPISAERAKRLAEQINAANPPIKFRL
jgi:hypothetical protein